MKKQKNRRLLIIVAVVLVLLLLVALTAAGVYAMRLVSSNVGSLLAQINPETGATAVEDVLPPKSIYEQGLLVLRVDPGGPAAGAGLRRGSIILSVNGEDVNTPQELNERLAEAGAGATVTLRVLNGPDPEEIQVTLAGERPYLGVQLAGGQYPGQPGDQLELPEPFKGLPINPDDFNFEPGAFMQSVLVVEVIEDSGAAKAGLQAGDVIQSIDGQTVESVEQFVDLLRARQPGDSITLSIIRDGESREITAALGANPDDESRAFLGIRPAPFFRAGGDSAPFVPDQLFPEFREGMMQGGAVVVEVIEGSPAAGAGLERGDVIQALDGQTIESVDALVELIGEKEPGDEVTLSILRGDQTLEITATLGTNPDDANRAFLGVQLGAFFNVDVEHFQDGEGFSPGEFFFRLRPGEGFGRFFGVPDEFQDYDAFRALAPADL